MQEIWWPLSGGYQESVAPMLPATKMTQPFCERKRMTGVMITKDMAAQEKPQRLEQVVPISEVVNRLEKAEYAMKEYDWRWTRVVDKGIRAICKWTRLILTITTVEFFPELNPRLLNMQSVD